MFSPHKPFQSGKWGLNITDSKLKAKQQVFLARPSGTLGSRKHIQVLTPVELIMTTWLALGLVAPLLQRDLHLLMASMDLNVH